MTKIFNNSEYIISEILNHILNRMNCQKLNIYSDTAIEVEGLYPKISIKEVADITQCTKDALSYIFLSNEEEWNKVKYEIAEKKENMDFVVYMNEKICLDKMSEDILGKAYSLKRYSSDLGNLHLIGKTFSDDFTITRNEFKVLAVIHCYNEDDIIGRTIEYLLKQNVNVYVVDNWSQDNTYNVAERYVKEYPGKVFAERFPEEGKTDYYEWYNQLKKTEELSSKLDYDWFIHYDADEMRISPWENKTLWETINHIDKLGYNLIENTVIDFKLTEITCDNIFMADTYFDFGHRNAHFKQIKTWKKTENIDIKTSGGHEAKVLNPKIFPLKILNRHYPLRSNEHARKKIFQDRLPRFEKEQNERGWHGHYQKFVNNSYLSDKSELLKWGENTFYDLYIPLFLGCGVYRIDDSKKRIQKQIEGSTSLSKRQIIIYGAGNEGKTFYERIAPIANVVGWVDSNYSFLPYMYCEKIINPQEMKKMKFDMVVIAIKKEEVFLDIKKSIMSMGIEENRIIWSMDCI